MIYLRLEWRHSEWLRYKNRWCKLNIGRFWLLHIHVLSVRELNTHRTVYLSTINDLRLLISCVYWSTTWVHKLLHLEFLTLNRAAWLSRKITWLCLAHIWLCQWYLNDISRVHDLSIYIHICGSLMRILWFNIVISKFNALIQWIDWCRNLSNIWLLRLKMHELVCILIWYLLHVYWSTDGFTEIHRDPVHVLNLILSHLRSI